MKTLKLIRLLTITICVTAPGIFGSQALADTAKQGSRFMVAAAHELATQAGLEIIDRGGSAVDAAVAVQAVLSLVEPQSSGIGGGAFMLYFDNSADEVITYDGRETSPMRATENLFLDSEGNAREFFDAVVGGLSVGTPGVMALLGEAHSDYGKLLWSELFQSAIQLSIDGFPVGERLASMLSSRIGEYLKTFDESSKYFFPDGKPLQAGEIVTNHKLAKTLSAIAMHGPENFYRGETAKAIVRDVQGVQGREGKLELADLHAYQAIQRPPVCYFYRNYRVCGMGPPSSGGIAVGQILGILENFDLPSLSADNPLSWHLIAEASKLAFADRNQYIADSDFVDIPVEGLLNRNYLQERASLIGIDSTIPVPTQYGQPPGSSLATYFPDYSPDRPGTSHFSIVDAQGNAVSMTTSIEGPFGSQLMVNGFMLNNQLTDFSFVPERDGKKVANRVQPGKRPRSSMSPTLVFNPDGSLRLVIGSPGGSRIIGYVVKTLVAVLDWNIEIHEAINLGNVVNQNDATELEEGTEATTLLQTALSELGHELSIGPMASGLNGIEIVDGNLRGGTDLRREGVALGN